MTLGRKRKSFNVFHVKTVELRATILAMCHERGDTWADAVQISKTFACVMIFMLQMQCTTEGVV